MLYVILKDTVREHSAMTKNALKGKGKRPSTLMAAQKASFLLF